MSQRSAFSAAASATAEVSDPPRPRVVIRPVGRDALEAGDHGDLARLHATDQLGALDRGDAGLAVGVVGADRDLPALPGAGFDADLLQGDREQAGGHLFAGGDHCVVFARVVQRRQRLAPADELVGGAGHGGDDDGDLVAGVALALDARGDGADAVEVGDRRAAEFHHDAGHGAGNFPGIRRWAPGTKPRADIPAGHRRGNRRGRPPLPRSRAWAAKRTKVAGRSPAGEGRAARPDGAAARPPISIAHPTYDARRLLPPARQRWFIRLPPVPPPGPAFPARAAPARSPRPRRPRSARPAARSSMPARRPPRRPGTARPRRTG